MVAVLYVPSIYRPEPVLRSIGPGWENSYIKHSHRSNGLVNKLYKTIGQSVLQTNHIASLRNHRSNGLVNKLYRTIGQSVVQTNHIASLRNHRSNGLVNKLYRTIGLTIKSCSGPSVNR